MSRKSSRQRTPHQSPSNPSILTPMNTPKEYPLMSPYLTVKGAAKAIEFYTAAFGATELLIQI